MFQKYDRYIAAAVVLLLVFFLIYEFKEVVSFVLIAWVISMIGDPVMKFFLTKLGWKKYKWGSSLAAVITLIVFFLVIGGFLYLFIPIIIQQAVVLSKVDFQAISIGLQEPIQKVNNWLRSLGVEPSASAADQLKSFLGSYFDPKMVSDLFGGLLQSAGSIFIAVFSVLFIAFYFLKEQGLFTEMVQAAVPTRIEHKVVHLINDISELLTRYFGGIVLQIIANTLFLTLFLSLLGINNALLIAFFAAIMNIIPYIGPVIGAAFGVMFTISSNLDQNFYTYTTPLLFKVVAVFTFVHLLDNFIFQPLILSKRVQAHPIEVFIIIMIGAKVGGIAGMVLAIPAYTVFRVIARTFFSEFKIIRKITEDMDSSSA